MTRMKSARVQPSVITDPDTGAHAANAANVEIGLLIRSLRRARSLSLKKVADHAELSTGYLSQLERGISSGSIRVLAKLADALDVGIAEILGGPGLKGTTMVARVSERRRFDFPHARMAKEVLTPFEGSPRLDIFIISIDPGGDTGDPPFSHHGEEAGVVMEGGIELIVDGQLSVLGQGDSFRFCSERPHRYRNAGPRPARVFWVNWRDKPPAAQSDGHATPAGPADGGTKADPS